MPTDLAHHVRVDWLRSHPTRRGSGLTPIYRWSIRGNRSGGRRYLQHIADPEGDLHRCKLGKVPAGRWLDHVAVHGNRRNGDNWRFLHGSELQLPEGDIDQLRGCASDLDIIDFKHVIVEHFEHFEHLKHVDLKYLDHVDHSPPSHDDISRGDNDVLYL